MNGNLSIPAAVVIVSALMVALALAGLEQLPLRADTLKGFEVDADHAAAGDALYSQSADDWSATAGSTGEPVFLPGMAGEPDFLGCYASDISVNPAINGAVTFMCDGSSDASFDGAGPDVVTEPELNIVSPGGKQIQDIWNVQVGSVTAKDDFSHAYSLFRFADSPCDGDTAADDPFLSLAGHRGDNEGDAFWGFELSQVPPTGFSELENGVGATFDLDFNRMVGDLLVSFTLVGGGTNPELEVFVWDGSTFTLSAGTCPADQLSPQGASLLRTNPSNDIQAPPWNVPVCDPTATNSSNNCRVVNGSGAPPAVAGDNLMPPRDFSEAIIDLSAFVAPGVCFDSLIFTSRSAHPLETADLKDVGGVSLNLCDLLQPGPTPTPTPGLTPTPTATPTPVGPLPTPTPTPNPPVGFPPSGAPPSGDSGMPWWALALAGSLLAGAAALLRTTLRRRRPRPVDRQPCCEGGSGATG